LGQDFDRAWVLAEVARERGTDLQSIEEALYADLPAEHILRRALLPSPDGLLCEYDLGQHQAVLLRAVRVSVQVRATSPECYRALFRRLKFHRLLCTVTKTDKERGYRVEIDGPFSLFEQTTKYGLKLALALPAIMECEDWSLKAELRWGKDRRPLRYQLRGRTPLGGSSEPALAHAELPDEVTALLADLGKQPSPWKASPANAILNLPGFGVCVPDLVFVHRESGEEVFFEVLGFWSREAVWKRVEMVQAGLPHRIVFAVGKHLRVSAEVLEDGDSGALYVYARTMRATAVLECVAAVAARPHP
jgi:predicted nuclease of restriction endonuclease-like RecB superfamily